MTAPSADEFYSTDDLPPQQGDVLLASVSRVVARDRFAPPQWRVLDEYHGTLSASSFAGSIEVPALEVAAGRALAMVCSHDCGLDREFNAVLDRHGLQDDDAIALVKQRDDLDRTFSVSPLVAPESVRVSGEVVDRGLLMAGRVIGYLPVPESVVNGRVVIPVSVVDLTYRATIDRLAYIQRLTCVSESTRERLRYALARLDVSNTPTWEAQLAEAVGQEILSVRVSKKNPLIVQLRLADGSSVELLQRPGSPQPGGSSRTRRSVR